MNLPFFIARRYLFAKKSHNAINIISMISVCSVAVATVALVCVLSVYNGFNDLVASMFGNFDPELKIIPTEGKVFDPDTPAVRQVRELKEVAMCTGVLQDHVLVRCHDRQQVAVAKGVEDVFHRMVSIDTVLVDGRFVLQEGETSYGVMGIGLASSLGVNAAFTSPMEIYAPKRDERVNMANPATSFQIEYAFIGGVFCLNQPSYDENYLILPIGLMRSMLRYEKEVTALELKLTSQADAKAVQQEIRTILGDGFRVQNRYEQQEASFKMMQVEKWMTFLILAFILTIALFNVVSSLSMLMIEKEDDVRMLRSMGANDSLIRRIFLTEGCMIPVLGALVGIVIGVALCLIQQYYGVIKLGTAGAFVSDNYPVRIALWDILAIFVTVFVIGGLSSWYPVRYLGSKWLKKGALVSLIAPLLLLTACGGQGTSHEQRLTVTMESQRYFVERIAGEHWNVHTVVPAGQSPETYEPTPREMMAVAESQAYLRIGRIGFEMAWMSTIQENNPHLRVFDLSEGVMWIEGQCTHHHHDYDHGSMDPHIWNSTDMAQIIARNTLDALCAIDPAHASDYEKNYRALTAEIDSTGRVLHTMLDTVSHRTFVIYHPALTYFANEYGLTQLSIEADGKEPSAASMKALVDEAREAGVRVVFVQQEFDRKHAESLAAEIGARVVTINPLSADWKTEMLRIAQSLATP